VNVVGGSQANYVPSGVYGATIAGGGAVAYGWLGGGVVPNSVRSDFGSIGGGQENAINSQADGATIGGGEGNVAGDGAGFATISGGFGNWIKSAGWATIAGGEVNQIGDGAYYSTIGGGFDNRIEMDADSATIPGGIKAVARSFGQQAYASGGFSDHVGTAQASLYVLRAVTTDGSPTELFLDQWSQRMKIPAGSTWAFEALIAARTQDTGSPKWAFSAGWRVTGVVQNAGGTTRFVNGSKTKLADDLGLLDANVQADDANDALAIVVTGFGAYTYRWVATVRTTEVMFPE
jgi:hypothetical protein